MTVRFACPKGHGIQAGDSMIGKSGKCPRCGTSYVVPDPAKIFLFLCPNGHRLNGPKTLQGKPGQCPHCGSKFRIPVLDDDESQQQPTAPEPGKAMASDQIRREELMVDDIEEVPDFEDEEDFYEEQSGILRRPPSGRSRQGHPLARTLEQLWQMSGGGRAVVHLTDGARLDVTSFAPSMSRESHAVFAVRNDRGEIQVNAVLWRAVSRIEFPKVDELSKDLFL